MRMAKFYSNENFPIPVVEKLRLLGHDVLTSQEAGQADRAIPDEEVLKFANNKKRTVLTFNRKHFLRLHRKGIGHAGIIVCTFDVEFEALAMRIHNTIQANPDISGNLIRVNRPII